MHLVGVRIPRTVGSDESVVAEVLVELAVVVVPVARIAIEVFPSRRTSTDWSTKSQMKPP